MIAAITSPVRSPYRQINMSCDAFEILAVLCFWRLPYQPPTRARHAMRLIGIGAARPAIFGAVGLTLAAGLITAATSASQTVTTHAAARSGGPGRVPGVLAKAAPARLMTARVGRRGGISIALPGETSVSQISAHARTGMLTGVVRSGTSRPFAGACVRAAGPAGRAVQGGRSGISCLRS